MPKLYVGVVIHGCPEKVGPCLDSILSSQLDYPTRFVFVDNGSPAPGEIRPLLDSALARDPERVVVHITDKNIGCSGGWNLCIRQALTDPEFEWIVLAGHDIIVHPQALNNLVKRYQRGGVDITSGVDAVYDAPMPEPVEQEVPGANFSLIMLPRRVVETIGLFDENIWPAYFEDNDYHFRCILGGMGVGVWTWLAPFRHARSSTVAKYPELTQHFAKNQAYFTAKWGGLPGEVLQKNEALKRACEDMERRRQLEAGEGWKKEGDGEPQS